MTMEPAPNTQPTRQPTRPPASPSQISQQNPRGSLGLIVPPSRSNSLSPDDNYNYHDVGPSPEDVPTKEREDEKIAKAETPSRAGLNRAEEGAAQILEEARTNVFVRHPGRRRARVPDEENPTNGISHSAGQSTPTGPAPKAPASFWRRRIKDPIRTNTLEVRSETKLRHVKLHWEKGEYEGREKLLLNAILRDPNAKSESQNHVVWQHSEIDNMRIDMLEDMITRSRPQGLQNSEAGLTRRLLKRVRKLAERVFVGGSFLTPLALRYDILDDSKYSVDKCCIFLSFPYFAVEKLKPRNLFTKGSHEHPPRTLLQSAYRLNDTVEQEKFQSIRMLKNESLRSCIDATSQDTANLSRNVTEELIYVPQLWALILGLDRMITTGPISDEALQGISIKVNDVEGNGHVQHCSLVRISFINQGRVEDLTYPIEQCASWFGLLNKHQQIRGILKQGKDKVDPIDYKLQVQGQIIDDKIWASVQQSAQEEVLEIWMKTPKPSKKDNPKISIKNADTDSESGSKTAHESDEDSLPEEEPLPMPPIAFEKLENAPIISSFFEWRILDEFGEPDESPLKDKLNRFLNAIYRSLPVVLVERPDETSASKIRESSTIRVQRDARPKLSLVGKTSTEIEDLLASDRAGGAASVSQKLFRAYTKLFEYFLPDLVDEQTAPVKLFWGAVYEILTYPYYLHGLLEKVTEINIWAERIHYGVYYRRVDLQGFSLSESAILLAAMVDAFGAVYNMLVEAVRDVQHGVKPQQGENMKVGKKVSEYSAEACRLLETARDELITEANGAAPTENVGPVLTPEAILIMLMERLVCGVYRNGNANIINIFEECLEHLALKVRDRYSRRLLQMINGFEEEVGIINNVLLQQQRVLVLFRSYLNPTTFKTPSTARKMRFDFETKGIERILVTIREQLRSCKELKERAAVLAHKNVQLVETLQDDNGRAIFIFTIVTVLFLPLSFVAGFFGMNLVGINGTTSTTRHFWEIGLPLTAGIVLLCIAVIFRGEDIWFMFAGLPRIRRDMTRKEKIKQT